MEVDLAGQVALVRGMDGPWGAAVAERLARSGAEVVREAASPPDMLVNADPALIDGAGSFAAVEAAFASIGAAMANARVVNIGSVFGLLPARGGSSLAGACAALWAQTRAAALDLAPRNIRVNGLAVLPEDRPHTPLRRAARPEDAAVAVLFLLAPASSYVTGEIVRVDGGWSSGFAREF